MTRITFSLLKAVIAVERGLLLGTWPKLE